MSDATLTPEATSPPAPIPTPWLLWAAVGLFVLTRGYLLLAFKADASEAYGLYALYAVNGIDYGRVPYKDFAIEYPPVAWWAIAVPRWIDPVEVTPKSPRHDRMRVLARYHQLFRWEMFLCDAISFGLVIAIARRRRREFVGVVALTYVIATALLAHLLHDRLDAGLLVLLALWAYCWLRSLESSSARIGWLAAAYLLLGLSISFKVVPVIAVPFLVLAEWHGPRRWRSLATALVALAIGVVGPFAAHYPSAGWEPLKFLSFHSGRGLQLESLASSLLIGASFAGVPVEVVHPYGGFDLAGPWAPLVKRAALVVLFGFLAATGLKALLEWKGYTRERAYRFALFVIGTSVIGATVLSPQYFVWAFPVILLLGVEVLPSKAGAQLALALIIIGIGLLTTWLFPYHYFPDDKLPSLVELDPSACIVLVLRNVTYLALMVWLGVLLLPRREISTS